VYTIVRQIPRGRVTTYGQIALLCGHPGAARTVGWALHALPANTDVPWQRVINAAGRISTTCVTHPADLQRRLLEDEGIVFGPDDWVDLRRYGWDGPEGP
jgi:methylated-DNA-protein-cysteine methyltransferase-like protein